MKNLSERARLMDKIGELEAKLMLRTAEAEGCGSLLLEVQQECIARRKESKRLREQLKIAQDFNDALNDELSDCGASK